MPEVKIETEDIKLVERIVNSNAEAYKTLYYKYSEAIFNFIYKKLRDEDTSFDFVQNIFMKLWENRSTLDPQKSIKSYLYRSANNSIIDHFRSSKVNTTFRIDESYEKGYEFNYENAFLKDEIKKAVDSLPEAQKTVFGLCRYEKLSYKEVGEILNISDRTVETHLRRAVKKLRELLKHLKVIIISLLNNL